MNNFSALRLLILLLGMMAQSTFADTALSQLMQNFKTTSAVKTAYRETRKPELFSSEWHGAGYLYSLGSEILIREQITPNRLLMGIIKDQIFYLDVENKRRYQSELDYDNPIALTVLIFKALATADENLLKKLYRVQLEQSPSEWSLRLTPKNQAIELTILIAGFTHQAAHKIEFNQDGDHSELTLEPTKQDAGLVAAIQALVAELQND